MIISEDNTRHETRPRCIVQAMDTQIFNVAEHLIDQSSYIEIIFNDEMKGDDIKVLQPPYEALIAKYIEQKKPLRVLVNLIESTIPNIKLYSASVELMKLAEFDAMAMLGAQSGPVHILVSAVVTSFSAIMPIKNFSDRAEAVDWLLTVKKTSLI